MCAWRQFTKSKKELFLGGLAFSINTDTIPLGEVEDGALVCERLPAGNYRLEAAAPKEVCSS